MNTGALLGRMNFALGLAAQPLPRRRAWTWPASLADADRGAARAGARPPPGARPPRRGVGRRRARCWRPSSTSPEITRPTADDRGPATPTWRSWPRWSWARPSSSGDSAWTCCTRRSFMKGGALALFALGGASRASSCARPSPQGARRAAEDPDRRSSSGARWTASAWSCRTATPTTTPRAAASRSPARSPGEADATVDLDGFFGLHPALAPLKPLWDDRRLAIVHAVRLARHDPLALRRPGLHGVGHAGRQEHRRRLARARPRPALPAREPASPFRAVALGPALPRILRGRRRRGRDEQRGRLRRQAGAAMRPAAPARGRASSRSTSRACAISCTGPVARPSRRSRCSRRRHPSGSRRPTAREYPRGPLRREPAADRPAHQGRRGARGRLRGRGRLGHPRGPGQRAGAARASGSREFGRGLAALRPGSRRPRWPTSWCSPCRSSAARSRENGNRGTDHGHATAMLVLGGAVQGRPGRTGAGRASRASSSSRAATSP